MASYIHNTNDILLEAGVDECGRGSLIYDVVAACVVLPSSFPDDKYKEIKDSKKLSAKKRAQLSTYIQQHAITYGIGTASNKEIDNTNILLATMKAMHRAIDIAYKKRPFHLLKIDGPQFHSYVPPGIDTEPIPFECVVKGDAKYLHIAAASILAKHHHDTTLSTLVDENPKLELYDLRKNQGYGTPKHLAAIKEYGITEYHRTTFAPCKSTCQK